MYPSIVVDNPGRPVWYETQSAPLRLSFNVKTELAQFDGTIHPIQQGPTPAVLKLRVYRMPILPVTPDTLDEYPEVGWEHHLNLALFAAGKALTTSRSEDAESKRIGSNLTKEWLKVVADAKRDRLRRQTPTPRFRRGGWAGRANSSNV